MNKITCVTINSTKAGVYAVFSRGTDNTRRYPLGNAFGKAVRFNHRVLPLLQLAAVEIHELGVYVHYEPKPPEVKIIDLYPAPEEHYNILDAKFFPADNKQQIIAVAVADDTNGWAAYIGVMPDAVMPSVATQIVARDGVKMFASEAAGLFPASAHVQSWVSRTYRK